MTNVFRLISLIGIALLFSVFFVLAIYDIFDSTFVPVTSAECGNQQNNCAIAVATGALVSFHDPNVGTNITEVSDRLKSITPTNDDVDGTNIDDLIHAIAQVWGP